MTLKEQIDLLNPWFYYLTIKDIEVLPAIGSKHGTQELKVSTKYFKNILVDKILNLYNFKNKTLLDIGSNCAFWSSFYVKNGAKYLTCIEGREKFIKQGKLYFFENNILDEKNLNFIQSDVIDLEMWSSIKDNSVDFSLCSGILYHIVEHELLLENIHRCTKEAVLIDTRVSDAGDKKNKIFKEDGLWSFDAIPASPLAKHPTKEFLINFFLLKGYTIHEIKSNVPFPSILSKNDNYDKGKRITFLAIKND